MMEQYVLPNQLAEAVMEACKEADVEVERGTFKAEEIEEMTKLCFNKNGPTRAAKLWNEAHRNLRVSREAVQKYFTYYKQHNAFFRPEERGRNHILPDAVRDGLLFALRQLRKNARAIDSRFCVAVAKGIFTCSGSAGQSELSKSRSLCSR